MPFRLAVLVSGGGSTLANLLDRIGGGLLEAEIELVVGSRPGLGAQQYAERANVRYDIAERSKFDSVESFSNEIFARIESRKADLVVCGGWLQLLRIPPAWTNRVVNVHPSLLPAFGGRGMYGRHVHEAVLAHGCKLSGCTVHFVDNDYDNGPIIAQQSCDVRDDDTPATLAARVQSLERELLPWAISQIAAGRVRVEGRRVFVVDDRRL